MSTNKTTADLLIFSLAPIACFKTSEGHNVVAIQPYSLNEKGDFVAESQYKKIDIGSEEFIGTIFSKQIDKIHFPSKITKRNLKGEESKKVELAKTKELFLLSFESEVFKNLTVYTLFVPAEFIEVSENFQEVKVNEFTTQKSGVISFKLAMSKKNAVNIVPTELNVNVNSITEIDDKAAAPYKAIQTKLSEIGIAAELNQVLELKTRLSEIFA